MTFGFDLFLYWVFHSWPFFCPTTRLWAFAFEWSHFAGRAYIKLFISFLFFCLLKSLNMIYGGATA